MFNRQHISGHPSRESCSSQGAIYFLWGEGIFQKQNIVHCKEDSGGNDCNILLSFKMTTSPVHVVSFPIYISHPKNELMGHMTHVLEPPFHMFWKTLFSYGENRVRATTSNIMWESSRKAQKILWNCFDENLQTLLTLPLKELTMKTMNASFGKERQCILFTCRLNVVFVLIDINPTFP